MIFPNLNDGHFESILSVGIIGKLHRNLYPNSIFRETVLTYLELDADSTDFFGIYYSVWKKATAKLCYLKLEAFIFLDRLKNYFYIIFFDPETKYILGLSSYR